MSNHTTGAQRTNARQDKIWEAYKQAQRKSNMDQNEREMAVLKGHLPQPTTGWKASGNFTQADADQCNTAELQQAQRELAEARATAAELLAALRDCYDRLAEIDAGTIEALHRSPTVLSIARAAIDRAEGRAQ